MDTKSQVTIRTKKLGLLIRDARLAARRSIDECAEAIGIRKILFRAYEEGLRAPSLPELETLVFFLDLPIDHFWGKQVKSERTSPHKNLDLPKLLAVRQRKIGALLRLERMNASISIRNLAHTTNISSERIEAYELGEHPIPLPELELLVKTLGGRVERSRVGGAAALGHPESPEVRWIDAGTWPAGHPSGNRRTRQPATRVWAPGTARCSGR